MIINQHNFFKIFLHILTVSVLLTFISCQPPSSNNGKNGTQLVLTGNWTYMDEETPSSLNYDAAYDAENPSIVVFDSKIYATWNENRSSSYTQIRVKEWNGSSWSFIDGNLNRGLNRDTSMNADHPDPISLGENLYVIWSEVHNEFYNYYDVRVKKWDGSTWSFIDGGGNDGLVDIKVSWPRPDPKIIAFGTRLYAIWARDYRTIVKEWDSTNDTWDRIDDGNIYGLNYGIKVWNNTPQLVSYNSKMYATWTENFNVSTDIKQIRVRQWNGGTSWSFIDGDSATGMNYDSSQDARNPYSYSYQSNLYITWAEDNSSDISQIRVKEWNGSTWRFIDGGSSAGLNYNTTQSAYNPQLTSFNSKLYATWSEYNGSTYLIRVKEWDGTQWKFMDGNSDTGIVYESASSTANAHPQLFEYQSNLYIIWEEENSTISQKKQIRVKKAELQSQQI